MLKKVLHKSAAFIAAGMLLIAPSLAADKSPIPTISDEVSFVVTPYLWAAGLTGNVDVNNTQRVHTTMGFDKVLQNLAAAAMGDGEVHYGRWGIYGNAVYTKLVHEQSNSKGVDGLNLNVNSTADAWLGIYTVAGTYTAYASKSAYLDVLAGARFLNLNAKVQLDASVQNTPYQGDKTYYSSLRTSDAVAGVKGRIRLGESSWYVPFYLDAGGGSSVAKLTSQQAIGIGYAFKDADVGLFYNNIYYSLSSGNISSYINMTGPAVAATFRF